MPYTIHLCECCGKGARPWITFLSVILSVAYLAANITINTLNNDVFDSICPQGPSLLRYSWASIVNILMIITIGIFSIATIETKGRFDDCKDNQERCCCCICGDRCCAATWWFLVLSGAISLAVYGTVELSNGTFSCVPQSLAILCIFSLIIQYGTIICALFGLAIRTGFIEYKPYEPHPPKSSYPSNV
jgi:hypothetical protein